MEVWNINTKLTVTLRIWRRWFSMHIITI